MLAIYQYLLQTYVNLWEPLDRQVYTVPVVEVYLFKMCIVCISHIIQDEMDVQLIRLIMWKTNVLPAPLWAILGFVSLMSQFQRNSGAFSFH